MASITPNYLECSNQPHATSKPCRLKLTITSITDSDATTNKRYIGWKLTIEGTPWVSLFAYQATLGGVTLAEMYSGSVTKWNSGHQLASGTNTYNNNADGTLTLVAFVKQLFYYSYNTTRWNNSTSQSASTNMVCSKLPRYATLTKHEISSTELNKFSVTWSADASCDAVQYSLNGGSWTNTSGTTYSITGLTPNTSYTIKTKVRRTDSQLWTESGTLTVKTAALPNTNTPSNFNLGSNITTSIANTNYLSKWYCDIYDNTTKIASSGDVTTTSKTVDLTNATMISSMLARHPNDNNWTITVKYYCVSNGVTYTLTQRTCSCIIPSGSYTPTFTDSNISYEVTDNESLNITGSNKKVIKGISDVTVTISPATPNGGASISSYNATSGSVNSSTTNTSTPIINLTNVNGNSIVVQAVDSRNRTKNITKNYTKYVDYFIPSFSTINISRYDGIGENLIINLVGSYCDWSDLAVTNIIEQVSIKYKLKTDVNYTTITGVTLPITNNSGTFTITGTIPNNLFSTINEYDLELTFKDKISNFKLTYSVPVGEALVWKDLSNKYIGINKKPNNKVDISGNTNIDGTVKINNTSVLWYS